MFKPLEGHVMVIIAKEIERMVELETKAWDTKDVEILLQLFHPDMVWPWPATNRSHDPMEWKKYYSDKASSLIVKGIDTLTKTLQ